MSKQIFFKKDIIRLKNNKNILNISDRAITYKDDCKRLFMEEYLAGKLSKQNSLKMILLLL